MLQLSMLFLCFLFIKVKFLLLVIQISFISSSEASYHSAMLLQFRLQNRNRDYFSKELTAQRSEDYIITICVIIMFNYYFFSWCDNPPVGSWPPNSRGLFFYEGWNFNSGNYLFTSDTKQIHVSKFYCPSMQSPALCTTLV